MSTFGCGFLFTLFENTLVTKKTHPVYYPTVCNNYKISLSYFLTIPYEVIFLIILNYVTIYYNLD